MRQQGPDSTPFRARVTGPLLPPTLRHRKASGRPGRAAVTSPVLPRRAEGPGRSMRLSRVQAHVQADGGACLPGPGLDKIADLVDQPQAVPARYRTGRGAVPDEQIGNLAGVSYLADDLLPAPPDLQRAAAVGGAQGVGGKLADGEHQVGDARRREPGTRGPAEDETAHRLQVVTVTQRLGMCGRAGQRLVTS